jgi:NADPH:quinone reductase
MRALHVQAYDGADSLTVTDIPARAPGEDEVEIRVSGVGVGYFDALLVRGQYQIKPPLPFVPGSAISGVVERVGAGVTHLAPGDHVAALTLLGGMAERVTLGAASCYALPASIPLLDAANYFVAYATSVYGLRELGRLREGEIVLVLGGAGTTGSAAIEVAKAMGARVIACASTEEKRARCKAAGADEVVDYTDPGWRNRVKAMSGRGVNVVYDPVGGDMTEAALRLVAPGGRHLLVGFVQGITKIPANLPLLKRCSLTGVNWGGEALENPAVVPPVVATLIAWTVAGKLRTAPDRVLPMERAGEAFASLLDRSSSGKIVITP